MYAVFALSKASFINNPAFQRKVLRRNPIGVLLRLIPLISIPASSFFLSYRTHYSQQISYNHQHQEID